MSKRWLINYLLITLIVIFTWIGNTYPINPGGSAEKNTLTRYKPQDIKSIKVETADNTIQLSKQGNNWIIESPISWSANNVAIERLTTLASAKPQSKLPKNQIDLSSLGLSIPRAVVTLNDVSIYFGTTNNIGNRRYLLNEPNIYLADDIHYAFINQGLTGLVDNRLLPFHLDLTSLKLTDIEMVKHATGWSSKTAKDEKQNKAATQLVNNWRQKQASNIQAYSNTHAPLNKVLAEMANGDQIEFYILSIQPEIIIARPDLKIQYHFPKHEYYSLFSINPPNE